MATISDQRVARERVACMSGWEDVLMMISGYTLPVAIGPATVVSLWPWVFTARRAVEKHVPEVTMVRVIADGRRVSRHG
jgi:hypothetical protein